MTPAVVWTMGIALFVKPTAVVAQEGTWTLSISGGLDVLSASAVNQTLDGTVSRWNNVEYIPVGPFDHFRAAPSLNARGVYRFDREMSVDAGLHYFDTRVTNEYRDPQQYLFLERTLGATELQLGLSYFFPPIRYGIETYASVDLGYLMAHAVANTYSTKTVKLSGTEDSTYVYYDTQADFRKNKVILTVGGGATMPLFDRLLLRAEVSYKLGQLGQMDGDIHRLIGSSVEPSATEFDYSMFVISVGLAVQL